MSSLRVRIIVSMLAIIFLIMAGSYFVIQDIEVGIIEGQFRNEGFLLANNLASEITDDFLINDLVEIRKSVENVKNSYPEIEYIFVTDSQGIVIVHTFEDGFPKALMDFAKPENVRKEEIFETEKGIIHEFDTSLFKNIGYVHIGLSENRVREQILDASRKILFLAIGAMILGGIFIYFIGKRLTEPILRLNEGAKRINKGILDQKIEVSSNDELGELARTFNDMSSTLDQKIKELVASKEKTEDAEKYLETLFDSIEDGIIVMNINHEIIKMNRSFLKIIGITEREVLGKTCHELIFTTLPSQSQNAQCPVDRLLQTGQSIRFMHETRFNARTTILDINSSMFLDKKGNPNIIMVIRDVTQHKILENEILLRNRELTVLNEISKNISEAFDIDRIVSKSLENILKLTNMEYGETYLIDDKSGKLTLINQQGDKCYDSFEPGKVNEVLIGKGRKNTVPTKNDYYSYAIIPLKSKDKVFGIIKISSNKSHIFSGREKELFSAIGNQIGVAIENISFYDNVKYLKEFNDEILNNINLALHVVDKDLRILAVNDELIKLSKGRIKREEIVNKNLYDVFPFLMERHVNMEYEHVITTGEIFQSEEKIQYYDEIIYTSTSKIPIKAKNGFVERIITVIEDVSEKKKLEEELKDSYEELKLTYSKLQELYKIKDNFLSSISHELRTPLTSVIGYTELMLDENLTPKQRHKIEIIFRNSKRLHRLIRALLDTQIINSSNLQLTKETVVINDLINAVVEDMKNMAVSKNIPVTIDIPDRLIVEVDIERLIEVFSNIVENAIKFTITGEIIIRGEMDNEKVHIAISDTGIGIPEDKLEKIFDRFYQVDSSNKRRFGGTGLGLWISKKIIDAHGGRIWAESKNRGSTFHILLPKPVK
ncbi:MAG: ATP-binding protein [Candidatus Methanoperedens sp.]|nr:ATP-binding protein [Candidatus Methanoperedens sp.]CAG0994428.1 two-component system, NarL family, sensor histidine kinase BarA [Methanosarcinales archaeon]